jgi:glycosyltransferase involved in cell wall biosynthesis
VKIAVDASCWNNRRGFGRFTRELLRALLQCDHKNEYFFLIDEASLPVCDFPARASTIVVKTRRAAAAAAAADGNRPIRDILRMTKAAWSGFNLIFFPAVYSYFPVPPRMKCIVTFHDAIAENHPSLIFPDRRAKLFWTLKTMVANYQADLLVTVSENARKGIVEHWKISPQRVRVITEGASPIFRHLCDSGALALVLKRFGLPADARFLLYVGGISPHKNLQFLVGAFLKVVREPAHADLKLLLVGDYEQDPFYSSFPSLSNLVRQQGSSCVVFTGYLPDEQLLHLYNGALALAFPSLEEGFGLPAVEGMACGTPILASNTGSLPEIVGDAGLFFDPRNESELLWQMHLLLTDHDMRRDLAERGQVRAARFTWTRSAESLRTIFEEI